MTRTAVPLPAHPALLGVLGRALETTLAYLETREAFRRPNGAFQALQHRMADMLLRGGEGLRRRRGRHVCGEAIQMHGGIGFTWELELDLHLYFKRAKTLEQHYGATNRQLVTALDAAGF